MTRHTHRQRGRRGSAALAGLVLLPSAALVAPTAASAGTSVLGPHVTTLTDGSSPVSGGSVVTILGHGFTGATAVDFGTVPAASFVVNSDGSITATAPPAPGAGPVEVTVTTPVGISTRNPGDVFTYVSAPVLDGQPSSDAAGASPMPVTLLGFGLSDVSQVDVGGKSVTPSDATDQSLTFVPPVSASAGTVAVSVISPEGSATPLTANSYLTYDSSPVIHTVTGFSGPNCLISCISPTAGPLAGGETFELDGSGFANATAVSFGGVTLGPGQFEIKSDREILGTVPVASSVGPVDIRVTTPGGISPVVPEDVWFYQASSPIVGATGSTNAPTVAVSTPMSIFSSLGLDSGPAGQVITLTGTGFDPTASVYFGTVPAAGVKYGTATTMTATVPAGLAPGTVPVTVSDSEGTSAVTARALFTSVAGPVVSAVGPESTTGQWYISGSGLGAASSVNFPGGPASSVQVLDDQDLSVTPPAGATPGDVTVTTPAGTSAITAGDTFEMGSNPTAPILTDEYGYRPVVSVSPPGGAVESQFGGVSSPVGYSGSVGIDFATTAAAATFAKPGCNPAGCETNIESLTVPPGGPGPVAVSAVEGADQSPVTPNTIWYYGPNGSGQTPAVTGLGETSLDGSGPGGSSELDLYGSGFTGATSVQIGTTQVTSAPTSPDGWSPIDVYSDDAMSVLVPPGLATGTVHVTVTTGAGTSASTTDDVLQIPAPSAPAPPSGSAAAVSTTVAPGSPATVTTTDPTTGTSVAATATGTGGVTVATYASDPVATAPPGATGGYADVKVSTGQNLQSLAVTMCGLSSNQVLEYYDGSNWQMMSPQQADSPAPGCHTAQLDDTTSTPRIYELTGTVVAVVNAATTSPPPAVGLAGRVAGTDAEGTAVAAFESRFPTTTCVPSDTVVLATDATYPDALAASYLAGRIGTGVLLTQPGSLSAETAKAISAEGIQKVVIVGGTDAVSDAVAKQLSSTPATTCGGASATGDLSVSRVAGSTEFDTAAQIASSQPATTVGQMSFPGAYGQFNDTSGASSPTGPAGPVPTAIVASGAEFQDATAASPLAYGDHLPVLLTAPSALPTATATSLQQLGVKQVLLLGGPAAVSDAVVASLQGMGISVLRVAGLDYGDTSSQLARFELSPSGTGLAWHQPGSASTFGVALARGDGYADALTSSVVTGSALEPVLLATGADALGSAITSLLQQAGMSGGLGAPDRLGEIQPFGGTLALSDTTVQAALRAANG